MRAAFAALTLALAGCASGPWLLAAEEVPLTRQKEEIDCGAAALASLLRHWGVSASLDELRPLCGDDGAPAGRLRDELRARGFEAYLIRATREDLEEELCYGRPVLVGLIRLDLSHYALVTGLRDGEVRLVDPAKGDVARPWSGFAREWSAAANLALVVVRPRDP